MKALFVALLIASGPAAADSSIVSLAQSWKGYFQPADPSRVVTARESVRAAMTVLDPMIARSEGQAFWRERFRWSDLTGELAKAMPSARVLDGIHRGLFFDHAGMEYPEVHRFRDAVGELRDAAAFATLENGEARYRGTLDEIMALVPRFEAHERSADRIELGKRVGWLERGRLAPTLTRAIRSRYGGVNSVAQFHIGLVRKYAIKPINQTSSGNYVILGNPTASTSTVTGTTYLRFIPSDTHAEAEVGMTGTMTSHSSSVGGERGVTVHVNGVSQSQVHVAKRITILRPALDGIVQHPATASVVPITSHSQINSSARPIMPRLPRGLQFIRNTKERIGYRTAVSRLPAGQAEGRRIAAGELASAASGQQVQVPPEVTNVGQQFQALAKEFIQLVQERKGVYPRWHGTATDESWLYLRHVRRTDDELTAFTPPPAFRTPDLQLGMRMHESEITNTANRQFSGQELTGSALEKFARSVLNYVPAPLRLGTHVPDWSARFIDDHPIVLDFGNDDRVDILLRLKRLEIGAHGESPARAFETPFGIRAAYRVKKSSQGPMLERLEHATLERLDAADEPLDEALVRFFLPKARALFKEELHFDGLTPVRGGIFEPLTKIDIREFRTERNWLLMGGNLDGDLLEIIKATPSGLGGDTRTVPR